MYINLCFKRKKNSMHKDAKILLKNRNWEVKFYYLHMPNLYHYNA